jgi:hypothetical protein
LSKETVKINDDVAYNLAVALFTLKPDYLCGCGQMDIPSTGKDATASSSTSAAASEDAVGKLLHRGPRFMSRADASLGSEFEPTLSDYH